jgi:hypothetical protein
MSASSSGPSSLPSRPSRSSATKSTRPPASKPSGSIAKAPVPPTPIHPDSRRGQNKKRTEDARVSRIAKITDPAFPPGIEAWENGLAAITLAAPSTGGTTVARRLGFQYPDPSLFLNESKRHLYLTTWLLTMNVHKSRSVADIEAQGINPEIWHSMPYITKQAWGTYLFRAKHIVNLESQIEDADNQAQTTAALPGAVPNPGRTTNPYLNTLLDIQKASHDLCWADMILSFSTEDDLKAIYSDNPGLPAEILWEIYESSFRFELMFLDMQIGHLAWRGQTGDRDSALEAISNRQQQLLDVFPTIDPGIPKTYHVSHLPNRDLGLAGDDWSARHKSIKALASLMEYWPGVPNIIITGYYNESRKDVEELEKAVAKFYCQSFYDTYGRPPVCPRRLPPSAKQRLHPTSMMAAILELAAEADGTD